MVRVLFLHPDLGIGGAERLVVDAAVALKDRGHQVSFLVNHHDPKHCFSETGVDGQLPVEVVGDWLPRKIFGRFYAFCAYLRMLYAAFYATYYLSRRENIDVIFVDQVSVGIPVLRLAKNQPKILFYCHFPDQLLSVEGSYLKKLYRAPLNYFEEYTIGMADVTLVNSKFTLRIFQETFRRLNTVPDVLYPSLNTKFFDNKLEEQQDRKRSEEIFKNIAPNAFLFLDINRYERKKNHELALKAFEIFLSQLPAAEYKRMRLIIAGGYDIRVAENIAHYQELQQVVNSSQKLQESVLMLRSPSDDEKLQLLNASNCLIYTPANEHFGIVPLEGMYMSKPVIAVNSGGPTETVVHNSTGFLCEQNPEDFSKAMMQIYKDESLRQRMGAMGKKRVQQKFSFEAFSEKLDTIIRDIVKRKLQSQRTKDKIK